MNHVSRCIAGVLASSVLASLASAPLAAQAGPNLIAPVYPGAVVVERLADRSFQSEVRAFLTKDPLATVRAFYDREVGAMQNLRIQDLNVPEELRSEMSRKDNPYVYAIGLGREQHTGVLGVEISVLEPQDEGAPNTYEAVGPVFEKLMMGQVAGEATKEQFDSVVEQYRHLSWKFYLPTDKTSDHGLELTADQVAFQSCEGGASGGLSTDEIMGKMQAAYAKGDFDEAQKLSELMMGAAGMSGWDTWMDCLKKIEEEAYTTLITIHIKG